MPYTYPIQLLEEIKQRWNKPRWSHESIPSLPSDNIVEELLEVCYHASFLTEEQRGLAFRVIFCRKDDLKKDYDPKRRPYAPIRVIDLQQPRSFSVGELMRITPATDFKKVLIGVDVLSNKSESPKLTIWGLVETGSSWWNFIHGESSGGMPPPNYLTISSNRPGYLSISRQGDIVTSLNGGQVSSPIHGVLYDGPVGKTLEKASKTLYKEVCEELGTKNYDPEKHDNNYPERKYIQYLERVLFHIRELNHGGVLIIVPDYMEADDPRIMDRLSIKYPLRYEEGWKLTIKHLVLHRKYYDLHFPLWNGEIELTTKSYREISGLESRKEEVDEALADSVKLVASLSGVDGAVLITDKLRVLGFGCEVIAQSHSLTSARLSSKARPTGKRNIPIESYGTRHRSTFRLCSSFEEAVAFIVSQDGGVKAVKRVGADLVLWPDINIGIFGL